MPNNLQDKQYLGDGVYVGHDGYQIWLQVNSVTDAPTFIALEPEVCEALLLYMQRHSMLKRGGQ